MIQIGIMIIVIGIAVFSIGIQRELDKKLNVPENMNLEAVTLSGAYIEGREGPVKVIIANEYETDDESHNNSDSPDPDSGK